MRKKVKQNILDSTEKSRTSRAICDADRGANVS